MLKSFKLTKSKFIISCTIIYGLLLVQNLYGYYNSLNIEPLGRVPYRAFGDTFVIVALFIIILINIKKEWRVFRNLNIVFILSYTILYFGFSYLIKLI